MASVMARNALVAAAVAILAFAGFPQSVFAAPAESFRAFGQGSELTLPLNCLSTGVGPLNLCPASDACACTSIVGHGTAAVMGGPITYTATVATNLSAPSGSCDEAVGTATLVSTTAPGNQVVLNFTGTLCSTPSTAASRTTLTANVVSATYFIDGANSRGMFHGATGSGSVTGSRDNAAFAVLGSVIGTIKLP